MIKTLRSNSPYLSVTSHSPVIYNNGMPNAGTVHYNTQTQCLQVFDGTTWHNLSSDSQIELTGIATEVITWAERKMHEERRLKELAATNPTLKDAIEALQRAEEQVRIVATLVQQ